MQANAFDFFMGGKYGKNPWGPGYRFKFRCTSEGQAPEFYTQEWTTAKVYLWIKSTKVATSKTDDTCIQETQQQGFDAKATKRLCNPKSYVTNPNEYGWGYNLATRTYFRIKGAGARSKRDVSAE
jgi:hypothetical protein